MKLKNICMIMCLFATQLSFATGEKFTTRCGSKVRSAGRMALIFAGGLIIGKYHPEIVDQSIAAGKELISDMQTAIRNGYNKIKPKNLFNPVPNNSEETKTQAAAINLESNKPEESTPELGDGKARAEQTLEKREDHNDPDNGQQ